MFALVSRAPEATFLAWAWRIPFLVSIVLVGVGLYIRLRLEETPVFREIEAKNEVARVPLVEVLTRHRRPFFTAVGLKLSEISYAQIGGVFAIAYVAGKLAMPRSVILNAILLSAVVAIVAIPLFGWLSDRIGRKTMFYASSLFAIGFAFPLFWLFDTRNPLTITLTIIAAIVFGQMVGFGVGAPWYSEMFAARLRYSGASFGFQIGAAISGGLTPFAAATFMAWTGGATWPISVYLIVLASYPLSPRWRRQKRPASRLNEASFCRTGGKYRQRRNCAERRFGDQVFVCAFAAPESDSTTVAGKNGRRQSQTGFCCGIGRPVACLCGQARSGAVAKKQARPTLSHGSGATQIKITARLGMAPETGLQRRSQPAHNTGQTYSPRATPIVVPHGAALALRAEIR